METIAPGTEDRSIEEGKPTLLLVDDEANILSALRRLFRPNGYRVLTAGGGEEGLAVLAREPVDLVISDMRMPNMDGSQFLAKVRAGWPDVLRVLLTGFADVNSTIEAINQGEIYRYISKPWDDNDVLLVVRHALERKQLEREKRRLEELTARQNEELRDLNANLEGKVKQRTADLRKVLNSLEGANDKLKRGFLTSIQVFANVLELRTGIEGGHARRVADQARRLALKLEMSPAEAQDVFIAALLHDLGKLGLPDSVLSKPENALQPEERNELQRHPIKGEVALQPLEQMREAAKLIRSHHERYDGLGYPDRLSGHAIPLGARILTVVNEYDGMLKGTLTGKRHAPKDALTALVEGRGRRYDPQVVDGFSTMLSVHDASANAKDNPVTAAQLTAGMVLTRDVQARDGLLLLSRDHILDDNLIRRLQKLEDADGRQMTFYVKVR
jgi:response regulator RpfG family c-di-GMP phosphodiesterase